MASSEDQLLILKTLEERLGGWNGTEEKWLDPPGEDDWFDYEGDTSGRIGEHNLLVREIRTDDLEYGPLDTDVQLGEYVLECMDNEYYEEGELRLYGCEMVEGKVNMHMHAYGTMTDSDTIYPTFSYNETSGLWISYENYSSEPWIMVLWFGRY